ncbi:MAG: hypothetical protein QNL43_04515 [Crocinitomicaceae bacterium]|jgi:hypothetical protein|tara:strand:- start:5830 stop:7296 length:1467 start_codon:yes stop_codon:yes gene_type:complete
MLITRDAKINYFNIGLMLMSAVFAFLMPFETFLFAYAFLGPLHYLTEISWLHDKQYFTKGKYDFTFLLMIGVVLSIAAFANDFRFLNFDLYPPLVDAKTDFVSWYYSMSIGDISIMLALFSAVLFVLFKDIKLKLVSILIMYLIVYFSFNLDMDLLGIFILMAIFSAALYVFVKNLYLKIACIALLYAGIYYAYSPDWFGLDTEFLSQEEIIEAQSEKGKFKNSSVVFALTSLVPTLIHVYVFTGLFMLFGALKSRSKTGLLSIVFFLAVPFILVKVIPVNKQGNYLSSYGTEAYYADGTGFFNTNVSIMRQFELSENMTNNDYIDYFVKDSVEKERLMVMFQDSLNKDFIIQNEEHPNFMKPIALADVKQGNYKDNWWSAVFLSSAGIMLMRFIAFAYLYHYLNWFSKTEIIRWHKVPKIRFVGVIALWIVACGLYIYDYAIGLSFLFFLSFTHVLLEFPLNITSIIGIGKETRSILKSGFSKKGPK